MFVIPALGKLRENKGKRETFKQLLQMKFMSAEALPGNRLGRHTCRK
jgi:hypothetical protein